MMMVNDALEGEEHILMIQHFKTGFQEGFDAPTGAGVRAELRVLSSAVVQVCSITGKLRGGDVWNTCTLDFVQEALCTRSPTVHMKAEVYFSHSILYLSITASLMLHT